MDKKLSSAIIIVIVETFLLAMLAIAFYDMANDERCECYCVEQTATVTIDTIPEQGSFIDEYIDWDEELMGTLEATAIVFGNTDPPSKLTWEDGYLHFEGNADQAAMEFIDQIIRNVKTVCNELDSEQCEPCPACGELYGCVCDCTECDCPHITLPEEAYRDGEEDATNYYTEKFRNYLDYFGEHGFVKPDYNDDIPLWMDFISEYGDIYSPTVEKYKFVYWNNLNDGWVFLTGKEYDELSMYFREVGKIPEGLDCSDFAPEGKPSNEYNEIEQKYVEGWNRGYEIGLQDQDAWNEGFHECEMICEELLDECGYEK